MTRTRLKTVWVFGFILSLLCAFAIYKEMDGVATILAGAIGGIVAKYTNDETKRKSEKR